MAIDPRQPQVQPKSNRIQDMIKMQEMVQKGDAKDRLSMVAKEQPSPNSMSRVNSLQQQPSPPPSVNMGGISQPPMNSQMDIKQDLNDMLTATMSDGDSLAAKGLQLLVKNSIGLITALGFNPQTATSKEGGLIGMAARGNFAGQVPGQGHGMQDNVYMPIIEKQAGQQVATLAVSPDEYVVDAHTMSALGNGSADEGARYMDNMVKNIRTKAYGTEKQPNEINGLAALRPMIERV